jgi:hypothetical protein
MRELCVGVNPTILLSILLLILLILHVLPMYCIYPIISFNSFWWREKGNVVFSFTLSIYYIPFIYPLISPILTTSIYSLILLQPYIYPFFTTIILLFFIFTLQVSPYHLSIYYTSIISLIFFYFKYVFLLLVWIRGLIPFTTKGGGM